MSVVLKDMPLPDELRPPNVLIMTMNYLLNNIMDAGGPGKWEDWFDFLWNRTRSIRKVCKDNVCVLLKHLTASEPKPNS